MTDNEKAQIGMNAMVRLKQFAEQAVIDLSIENAELREKIAQLEQKPVVVDECPSSP